MKTFDVYNQFDVVPVKGKDVYVYDEFNNKYLDLYGGHAVISIGHSEKKYVKNITNQLKNIGFYSNAVRNPLQDELSKEISNEEINITTIGISIISIVVFTFILYKFILT